MYHFQCGSVQSIVQKCLSVSRHYLHFRKCACDMASLKTHEYVQIQPWFVAMVLLCLSSVLYQFSVCPWAVALQVALLVAWSYAQPWTVSPLRMVCMHPSQAVGVAQATAHGARAVWVSRRKRVWLAYELVLGTPVPDDAEGTRFPRRPCFLLTCHMSREHYAWSLKRK